MSYIVSVRHADGRRIEDADVGSLVQADSELELAEGEAGRELVFFWRETPDAERFAFVLADGEISTSGTPSDAVLSKLQSIAAHLGARVIGEAGEDLTDVAVPSSRSGAGCTPVSVFAFLALAGLTAWWWF